VAQTAQLRGHVPDEDNNGGMRTVLRTDVLGFYINTHMTFAFTAVRGSAENVSASALDLSSPAVVSETTTLTPHQEQLPVSSPSAGAPLSVMTKDSVLFGKQAGPGQADGFSVEALQRVYEEFTATTLVQEPLLDGTRQSDCMHIDITVKPLLYWIDTPRPSTGIRKPQTEMRFSSTSKPTRILFLP
jgi:hypothetical protein